jgi:hypothetical protein
VLDDGDLDAGLLEPFEPFDRVEQEGRCGADENLVGMMVEGDDGRSRAADGRLVNEVA